jgi:WD40 repeat protein
MRTFQAHRKDVYGLAFAPDGHTLASVGGQSAAVSVWDLGTGELLHKLPGWRDMARVVARGPAGLIAAASSRTAGRDPNLVRVWRLPAIEPLAEFVAESKTFDLAFLPDGTGLVTASQEVRLWDLRVADHELKGDRPFVEPPTMNRWFHAAGVSPDGTRVAIGSLAAVSCWWPATGVVRQLDNVRAQIHAVTFDPTGRELAVAFGHQVRVYDLEASRGRLDLVGHQGMVWEAAYTPDGARLVTASSDGSVRFWDARTGAARGSFDWQAGKVRCVAVSPDGLTVASGGQDGRIVIADVDP